MKQRVPDAATEQRLEELRAEASLHGRVEGKGIHPPGAPMPAPVASPATGYYGLPLLKAPVWTWEVPTYFFVGGAAGASAVLALAAQLSGSDGKLVRDARWIACIGANLSAPLLIADLGRPERFLNMMRIFKPQSPMSVGAWIVAFFGASATTAAIFRTRFKPLGDLAAGAAALSGLGMATYTGVLLGATAIPVWSKHVKTLPMHFGASGLASADTTSRRCTRWPCSPPPSRPTPASRSRRTPPSPRNRCAMALPASRSASAACSRVRFRSSSASPAPDRSASVAPPRSPRCSVRC